jgi:hypothetical protein
MSDSGHPAATLTMTRGPDAGRRFDIAAAPVTIGRQDQCEVQVAGTWVSRRHARIAWTGTKYIVEDLGSTNGTFVNSERVSGPRMLQSGDRLQLGEQVEFAFEARMPVPVREEAALPGMVPSQAQAPPPQPKRSRIWIWALGLLGLLVIIAAGVGVYYLLSNNEPQVGETSPAQASEPESTPVPTTGSITGMVLGDDGKPLLNINDQETMIVALFCPDDDSAIECFPEITQEMDFDVLYASICEAGVAGDDCLLHFGQGAVPVEADGSYTITNIPPGQYGLIFLYHFPEMGGYSVRGFSIERQVEPVQMGELTENDIMVDFHRE